MAKLTQDKKKLILADWKAGISQHYLAKKYEYSSATINKICKGVEQENKEIVNAQVSINTALSQKSEQEVNSISKQVEEKTRHLQFITNLTLKNLKSMGDKIDEDLTIFDHKAVQDTIHKGGQTLGVIDSFAPKIELKQELNQQNNAPTQINIIRDA
jgi:hypothetical protein